MIVLNYIIKLVFESFFCIMLKIFYIYIFMNYVNINEDLNILLD